VKAILLALCTAAVALSTAQTARACSYPPGFDHDRELSENMAAVTAIYEGRIEDVSQGPWHGAWNFTLRSTRSVWGASPPARQRLTRENGACSNWLFITDQDGDAPEAGTNVVIFATPQGMADSLWLYIARADSPTAAVLFERFRSTSAGRQFQAAQ